MEQHGGRTHGDARLDRGMQESILVPSSVSDICTAPANQTREEELVEQHGGCTHPRICLQDVTSPLMTMAEKEFCVIHLTKFRNLLQLIIFMRNN